MNTAVTVMDKAAGLGQQVVEAMKPLAEKLGVASTHLYEVLVRQSMIQGITNMATGVLIFGLLFYVGVRLGKYTASLTKEENERCPAGVLSWVLRLAAYGTLIVATASNLPLVLNPEYYAIKELLGVLQGVVK